MIAMSILLMNMALNHPLVFIMLLHHDHVMPLLQLLTIMLTTMMMIINTTSVMLIASIICMMIHVLNVIRTMMMLIEL